MSAPRTPATARLAAVLIWGSVIATVLSAGAFLFSASRRGLPSAPEMLASVLNLPVFPSLVSVALMALLTSALVRRKRFSLVWLALLQIGGTAYSLARFAVLVQTPHDDIPPLRLWPLFAADLLSPFAAILVLIVAWRARGEFPGRLTHRAWLLAALVGAGGLLVSVGLTHLLLLLSGPDHGSELELLGVTLGRAVGVVAPHLGVHAPAHVSSIAGILLGATILLSVLMFLTSPRVDRARSRDQEVAVRELLAVSGEEDSLGYFATRRDKSYAFGPEGRAAIAYRVEADIAVAAGDPIGPREHWDGAMRAFFDLCRARGWPPAVLAAGEDAARAWTELGLIAIVMGDEAILHVEDFARERAELADVRRAAAHARGAGLEVRIRRHRDLSEAETLEMMGRADLWRAGGPERGYSMALGRLGDPADGSCLLVSAHAPDGTLMGLLSFVPWGRTGVSLDVMRRSPEAPNGVTELMVTTLLERGRQHGIRRVSLNFAMFKQVFDDARKLGAGPGVRLAAAVLERGDRWFQLERLYRANQKYRPEWVPRYLMTDGLLAVPRTSLVAGVLEGFLRVPGRRPEEDQPLSPAQIAQVRAAEEAAAAATATELAPERSEQSLQRVRRLEELRAAGMEPFPRSLPAPMPFAEAIAALAASPTNEEAARLVAAGEESPAAAHGDEAAMPAPTELLVAGRVRGKRKMGKVAFVDLADGTDRIQLILERDRVGSAEMKLFTSTVDVGDLVQVRGLAGRSRRDEPSLIVTSWAMAAKALQPVPYDAETSGDSAGGVAAEILAHPSACAAVRERSAIVRAVRDGLLEAGALEVTTEVSPSAGARPAFAGPAPRLEALVAAGCGPLFALGTEQVATERDEEPAAGCPVIEVLWPYADAHAMQELAESLVLAAARSARPAAPAPVLTPSAPEATEPGSAEQRDLALDGHRIATARSLIVDPLTLRERLAAEAARSVAAGGRGERALDEDLLATLETGMPPAAALRLDIGALAAVLTGGSIPAPEPTMSA